MPFHKKIKRYAGILAVSLTAGIAITTAQNTPPLEALTGLSINAYIQEIKLQKARHLLESKAYNTIADDSCGRGESKVCNTIAEVAFACNCTMPAFAATTGHASLPDKSDGH